MGKFGRAGALLGAVALACAALGVTATAQEQNLQYSAADIQAGGRLYGLQCAVCHGQNGDGVNGVNLPRNQFRRASTDDDIRNTITNGVAAAGMPPFRLQPGELNGLVAFIRSGFDRTGATFRVGDARRGQAIFDGKGGCASCHRVNGRGSRTAPDLSDIGSVRQPAAIQRSLVEPNTAMLPINRTVRIVTADGRTIRGRRINEDTFTVQLIDQQERLVSLDKSDIREYEIAKASDMPSFAGKLSDAEIADLLAYLVSLKG